MRCTIPYVCLALAALLGAGCVSSSRSQRDQATAFEAGRQHARQEQRKLEETTVWFRGDVKNPRVPWVEGMTLAQGLLAAQYSALWDPHRITLTRQGQTRPVNMRLFLAGSENPSLEPGDVVEVRR